MAKVRVITLKDQQKNAAKTLYKASILYIVTTEEPEVINPATLIKEPLSTHNLITPFNTALCHIQPGKPADIAKDTKLVCTGTFSGN